MKIRRYIQNKYMHPIQNGILGWDFSVFFKKIFSLSPDNLEDPQYQNLEIQKSAIDLVNGGEKRPSNCCLENSSNGILNRLGKNFSFCRVNRKSWGVLGLCEQFSKSKQEELGVGYAS